MNIRTSPTDHEPRYAAAQDWIDAPAFSPAVATRPDQVADGRRVWLVDTQFNLARPRLAIFTRRVVEVVNADGLQDAAQFNADYNPAFERIDINHVRVIRRGEVRNFDPRGALQVLRREPDLERARYDGRLTAHFVIPDVRVGDIVDVARTHYGQHPVLAGKFAAEWVFNWGCWVGETRVKVLAPANRLFATKAWNGAPEAIEQSAPGGLVERTWRLRDTAPAPGEPGAVPWARSLATVQFADVMTWTDVADTFRPLYRVPDRLPDDLEREVQAIEAATSDPAVKTVKALRLVQGALRYLSVSIGDGGFTPNSIDQIWASRCGDCKDASLLLVAMLRRMGVRADPALVNTWRGQTRAEELPGLASSDHCVVRAEVGGKAYWLDPTAFPQGGRLDRVHQFRCGWALPLSPGATLEFMGEDPVQDVFDSEEIYTFGTEPGSPATLDLRTSFGAWRADDMRRRLESGRAQLEEEFRSYYARRFGGAELVGEIGVADDLEENILTVTERYSVSGAWTPQPDSDLVAFETPDDIFAPNLHLPKLEKRRLPADLGLPRRLRTVSTVHVGKPINVSGWSHTIQMDGIRATSVHEPIAADGSVFRLVRTLEIDHRVLLPEQVSRFDGLREEAFRLSAVRVTRQVRFGQFVDPAPSVPAGRRSSSSNSGVPIWTILWILLALGTLGRCAAAMAG